MFLEMGGDLCQNAIFWQCTSDAFHNFAILEQHDGGDADDAVTAGNGGVAVYVDFSNFYFTFVIVGDIDDMGGDHVAGSTPFGPKVHEGGDVGI